MHFAFLKLSPQMLNVNPLFSQIFVFLKLQVYDKFVWELMDVNDRHEQLGWLSRFTFSAIKLRGGIY